MLIVGIVIFPNYGFSKKLKSYKCNWQFLKILSIQNDFGYVKQLNYDFESGPLLKKQVINMIMEAMVKYLNVLQ